MKKISIIVAVADNNAIGRDNKLLWHIPGDMKYFKRVTTGHTVVMGRNTYLSLPGGALKNRRNIVLTDNPDDRFEGCETAASIEEILRMCDDEKETFIIGGASVYRQFLPYATRLYLTRVYHSFKADTFFPEIDKNEWAEVSKESPGEDEMHELNYEFIILQRK